MRPHLELRWRLGDTAIEPRLIELLRGIAQEGSLQQAIARARLSYRHAWSVLEHAGNALGERLVVLERGRGARLAPLAEKLLRAVDETAERLGPQLTQVEKDWERRLAEGRLMTRSVVLIHASHDMALAKLRDRLRRARRFRLELHFHGSLDALAALARGACDLAGFHVPDTAGTSPLLEHYRPWLKARTLRLVHFATRQQGLIVAKSNPLGLETLRDVARAGVRFVNRQPGSGTRLFFDHLMAANRIRPAQINGYQYEEFTHAAVAATVASGMADAGFGIEAAARQLHLDFVPLASERYFLAARSAILARPGPAAFLAALRSGILRSALHNLPGYRVSHSLDLLTVHDAFG